MIALLARCLLVVQVLLAVRVFSRMARTAQGTRIVPQPTTLATDDAIAILVPVLNEVSRLEPCLAGLIRQGPVVQEIVVVDGGSTDGTPALVDRFIQQDARLRAISAAPVPSAVNGKSYGLAVAERSLDSGSEWVLVIDADVRVAPGLAEAMLAKARNENLAAVSAATRQRLSGPAEGVIHPAMLTTLVYRFGIPGQVVDAPEDVQANGQCLLVKRDALDWIGGFEAVERANAEDVTLVRYLTAAGYEVGFFEAGDLVEVEMYPSWRAAWDGWSRSLPMRDQFSTWRLPVALAEVLLVQAAPLWLAIGWGKQRGLNSPVTRFQAGLVLARLGVLAGMRRAYVNPPPTYWISPLADVPVALKLIAMARRRRFSWRGRDLIPGDQS